MTFSGNSIEIDATPSLTEAEGAATALRPTGKGGFFATLTPDQEARVMAYRGPETLADASDLAEILADAPKRGHLAR